MAERELEAMSIKDLKSLITTRGGNPTGCVEKKDLLALAMTLTVPPLPKPAGNGTGSRPPSSPSNKKQQPPPPASATTTTTTTGHDSDNDVATDDEELMDEDEDSDEDGGGGGDAGSKGEKRKGSLAFRASKFMASKVGNTRAGRTTIIKILGDDGDAVVKAFKNATAKLDGKLVAKERKKTAIRLVMKAYNLWRHKDLTMESTKELQTCAQLFGEMFVRDSASITRVRGNRNVTALVKMAAKVREACAKVMKPHIQEKNLVTLTELLQYYGSNRFLQALLNSPEFAEECVSIERACGAMLTSMTPLLLGESEKASLRHRKELLKLLNKGDKLPLERAIEDPRLLVLFQEYLDLEMGLSDKNTLRLLLAVREYEKISSRGIMKIRAPKLVDKFLSPKGDCFVAALDRTVIVGVKEQIEAGIVNSSLFSPVLASIRKNLEDDFYQSFVPSEDFARFKADLVREIAATEAQLKEQGSMDGDGLRSP